MIYYFTGGDFPTSAIWFSHNAEYSGHCAVGDIDDNGWPDLIVANFLGAGFGDPNVSDLYLNSTGFPSQSPSWTRPA